MHARIDFYFCFRDEKGLSKVPATMMINQFAWIVSFGKMNPVLACVRTCEREEEKKWEWQGEGIERERESKRQGYENKEMTRKPNGNVTTMLVIFHGNVIVRKARKASAEGETGGAPLADEKFCAPQWIATVSAPSIVLLYTCVGMIIHTRVHIGLIKVTPISFVSGSNARDFSRARLTSSGVPPFFPYRVSTISPLISVVPWMNYSPLLFLPFSCFIFLSLCFIFLGIEHYLGKMVSFISDKLELAILSNQWREKVAKSLQVFLVSRRNRIFRQKRDKKREELWQKAARFVRAPEARKGRDERMEN